MAYRFIYNILHAPRNYRISNYWEHGRFGKNNIERDEGSAGENGISIKIGRIGDIEFDYSRSRIAFVNVCSWLQPPAVYRQFFRVINHPYSPTLHDLDPRKLTISVPSSSSRSSNEQRAYSNLRARMQGPSFCA